MLLGLQGEVEDVSGRGHVQFMCRISVSLQGKYDEADSYSCFRVSVMMFTVRARNLQIITTKIDLWFSSEC